MGKWQMEGLQTIGKLVACGEGDLAPVCRTGLEEGCLVKYAFLSAELCRCFPPPPPTPSSPETFTSQIVINIVRQII